MGKTEEVLAAIMATALAGCNTQPSSKEAGKEADMTCYWSAEAHTDSAAVREALEDGMLTGAECDEVVRPAAARDYEAALTKVRNRAVAAARNDKP